MSTERAGEGAGRNRDEAKGVPLAVAARSAGDWVEPPGGWSQSTENTLQHSRERVASRWLALRDTFTNHQTPGWAEPSPEPQDASICAVFSLAGGVGKTSLTATLGRAFLAAGEEVTLAEVTADAMLPLYFGAPMTPMTHSTHSNIRDVSEPIGPGAEPGPKRPTLLRVEPGRKTSAAGPADLERCLDRCKVEKRRAVIDLETPSPEAVQLLLQRGALFLVPVAPDATSVLHLQRIQQYFGEMASGPSCAVHARYLLTQFQAELPLHLDVRQALQRRLGNRLLPFVLRRSQAVAEALAQASTVLDYAPQSGVAADYRGLADWIRSLPSCVV